MVDDSDGAGGITTQGQDLRDLQQLITEAVGAHFDDGTAPRRIRIHFVSGGGQQHKVTGWIFLEWKEKDMQERFGEFSAVELLHFVESL